MSAGGWIFYEVFFCVLVEAASPKPIINQIDNLAYFHSSSLHLSHLQKCLQNPKQNGPVSINFIEDPKCQMPKLDPK
jgi:hypothetical protein